MGRAAEDPGDVSPAIGLLEFYFFGGRNRWLLIPINILTVISLLFFAVFSIEALTTRTFMEQPLLAFVLIGFGALLLIPFNKRSKASKF